MLGGGGAHGTLYITTSLPTAWSVDNGLRNQLADAQNRFLGSTPCVSLQPRETGKEPEFLEIMKCYSQDPHGHVEARGPVCAVGELIPLAWLEIGGRRKIEERIDSLPTEWVHREPSTLKKTCSLLWVAA